MNICGAFVILFGQIDSCEVEDINFKVSMSNLYVDYDLFILYCSN